MENRRFTTLLLRGALGGALGGFLWAAVAVLASTGLSRIWWYWLLIGYLYQGLPLGMIIGAFVGSILKLIGRFTQLKLEMISRILTGSLVATMIAWIAAWWSTEEGDFFPTPWHLDFLWIVLFGAATGGIAGIMARTRNSSRRVLNEEKPDLEENASE